MWNLREQIGATLYGLGLGTCLVSVVFLGLGSSPARCALAAVGGVLAVAVGSYLILTPTVAHGHPRCGHVTVTS